MSRSAIRRLNAGEAQDRLGDLTAILLDAVANGASVNFLTDLGAAEAGAFWRQQLRGIAEGTTRLLVAEEEDRLLGTVMVFFAHQPNAPHRAEIGKMLVHSRARRRGLGRALLTAAEEEAEAAGRWLLLLDTESGSAGEALYRACGWTPFGEVPEHALRPNGVLAPTTFFWKRLCMVQR